VAHRDVKPSNILFDGRELGEGRAKLCDFGFAITCNDKMVRQRCGTAQYFAPELTEPSEDGFLARPTDMWAFGAVVFEMLHGMPAFTGGSIEQILQRIRDAKHAPFAADLGSQPKSLMQALFVKEPTRRLSAEEVMQHTWIIEAHGYKPFQKKAQLDLRGTRTSSAAAAQEGDASKKRASAMKETAEQPLTGVAPQPAPQGGAQPAPQAPPPPSDAPLQRSATAASLPPQRSATAASLPPQRSATVASRSATMASLPQPPSELL